MEDSFLTLTSYEGPQNRYNLSETLTYPSVINENGSVKTNIEIRKETENNSEFNVDSLNPNGPKTIRVPMPRRSLLILWGRARYAYEHRILREDIAERRLCITYRELTPPFLEGGKYDAVGKEILEMASHFFQPTLCDR